MRNYIFIFISFFINNLSIFAQYNEDDVELFSTSKDDQFFSVVKMDQKEKKIKAKYFSVRNKSGLSSHLRYESWVKNKKIVAYMSAGYVTENINTKANQVGLTIENGELINSNLSEYLGGLAIIQNDEIKVFNLKNPYLELKGKEGSLFKFNLNESLERASFIKWAAVNNISAFQCHLLAQNDSLLIFDNASNEIRNRRFLIGGINDEGLFSNYIINFSKPETLLDATKKAMDLLKKTDNLRVYYVINHDAGSDDVFKVFRPNGDLVTKSGFQGYVPITSAGSLIVFYYE